MTGCNSCEFDNIQENKAFAKALKIVLATNVIMFFVESIAAYFSQSASLQADAVDFLGDSLSYSSALYVLRFAPIWHSRTAFLKGIIMGCFGLAVIANAIYHYFVGALPNAETIGLVGILALVVNINAAFLLRRFREGDSNKESVWVCSRNDAIANILVIFAGVIVYFTQSNLPDIIVALIIGFLALNGSLRVLIKSCAEIKNHKGAS